MVTSTAGMRKLAAEASSGISADVIYATVLGALDKIDSGVVLDLVPVKVASPNFLRSVKHARASTQSTYATTKTAQRMASTGYTAISMDPFPFPMRRMMSSRPSR